MRKRLFRLILLTAVPVLFALAWYMSDQSFQLSLAQEKQRAQLTESIIFQEVRGSMAKMTYSQAVQAAKQYRSAYAAQGIELIFCWNTMPIAGATLPSRNYEALLQGRRAAMLDVASRPQRYAVAEPVNSRLTMLLLRDVSGLYTLRDQFRLTALLSALGASLLLGLLGLAVAGLFTKPIRKLTDAADCLSRESGAALSLPTARKDEIGALARAFDRMQSAVQSREDALRQESDSRQTLLDALAHEMRTPPDLAAGQRPADAKGNPRRRPRPARGKHGAGHPPSDRYGSAVDEADPAFARGHRASARFRAGAAERNGGAGAVQRGGYEHHRNRGGQRHYWRPGAAFPAGGQPGGECPPRVQSGTGDHPDRSPSRFFRHRSWHRHDGGAEGPCLRALLESGQGPHKKPWRRGTGAEFVQEDRGSASRDAGFILGTGERNGGNIFS